MNGNDDVLALGLPTSADEKAIGEGLQPSVAILMAIWYGFTAAAAMSRGFEYLHEGSHSDYIAVMDLMWAAGVGIGVWVSVLLARNKCLIVGATSSLILSAGNLWLLHFIPIDQPSAASLFGYTFSTEQVMLGTTAVMLTSGLVGTAMGSSARAHDEVPEVLLGIRHRHWLWLWLAFWAWVSIIPTGIYYFWLEIISTGYVLIHPSLWFSEAWSEGWTITFGMLGTAALIYGIERSLRSVSSTNTAGRVGKRILSFLLGTLVLAGPVANTLFRIAIHDLKHLPDGITTNPWWVLQ